MVTPTPNLHITSETTSVQPTLILALGNGFIPSLVMQCIDFHEAWTILNVALHFAILHIIIHFMVIGPHDTAIMQKNINYIQ